MTFSNRTVSLIFLFALSVNSCQLSRFVFYNFADIRDHKKFPQRPLTASDKPFRFPVADKGRYPATVSYNNTGKMTLDDFLKKHKTVAFLIIRNDTIQYEKYFRGYDSENIVPSFSMAKSVTSILIGCAISEGLIGSVDEPVTTYIPELKQNGFDRVSIRHLLQMTSGLNFMESYYNPFGHAASFYYGRNLRKKITRLRLKREPGEQYEYVSGNSQLLGLVLERALKGRTITDYLQEKIWSPLGMEYGGGWSLDKRKDGLEKTFCCLNARARDFAKIGRLYLNKGAWNGQRIVPESWVKESTRIDTAGGSAWYYQYQWWIPSGQGDFLAQGILGQYIYVHPSKNLVIVRLGKNEGKTSWWTVFRTLAAQY